ncbi:hypothetical protein BCR32DRAFT_241761 [Anaeromyces robustus]|uniref:P-loop containing nucleoside triphosphate hydrolase protein n=1 Tax=Anaeromyces robustus TaxID=1754192 RepID=A0A1Y1XJB9_9FUNG|nr:hypothetical protein BCR32DRAFT_241761 [Anaeromyces robustus]|eukprot:ORX85464.1 hypothetical protein BCR32DRAFT_241761 [Anaeromyces robustus]
MKKLCSIIVCGPAVGKTYLSKKDSRFIDLDSIKAKYKYGISDEVSDEDFEKNKSNRGEIVNHDSFDYVLNILKREIQLKEEETGKIILLSYNKDLLNYINNNNIEYCLVYPKLESRIEYIQRMKQRNNNEKFIEAMTNENSWKRFYIENSNDTKPKYKIELKEGQYLSDIINQLFIE